MDQTAVLDLFRQSGALLEGHFRLTSGLHSSGYLQCALVLQHPSSAEALGRALASKIGAAGATAVLSPALGGLIIGHEVARALSVRALFAERQDGTLSLRRGFTLSSSDRVVVIEDVVTTGGSTRETIEVARRAGATVIAAGSIIDRSGGAGLRERAQQASAPERSGAQGPPRATAQGGSGGDEVPPHNNDNLPYRALATLALPTYQPDACPLCAKGSPVTKPGSRA